MHILVVDDDRAVRDSLARSLQYSGYEVSTATDGVEALAALSAHRPDAVIMDVMMPRLDGLETTRALRATGNDVPILVLTARDAVDDRVDGLDAGADDYMTKPFHKDELVARIHAIVRRSKGHAQSVIQTGDLVVNLDTKTVEVGGQRVHLTGKEYQMLELLSLRKGTTLTKEMFLNHLYGGMDEPELKIIDVFICKLRKKLANASQGRNYIETVWGRGYVLREPSDDEARIAI